MVATQDQGAGTIEHRVSVSGNDLPGTVGNNDVSPNIDEPGFAYQLSEAFVQLWK